MDTPVSAPTKKTRRKREKPVNRTLVAGLLANGYSKAEIARKADCTEQTVYLVKKGVIEKTDEIKAFLSNRANLFVLEGKKNLDMIEKLRQSLEKSLANNELTAPQKMSAIDIFYRGFGIIFDKERLETGKATSIHGVFRVLIDAAVTDI